MTEPATQAVPTTDADSAEWLRDLAVGSRDRDLALARLHALLLRAAHAEVSRRAARVGLGGQEVEDLAHQAADDALMAILRRLPEFRGVSRFTTWAYKFAILEVSNKLGRHFWVKGRDVALDGEQWGALPARMGVSPESAAEVADLFDAVRDAVDTRLTPRQRSVFVAIAVDGVPLDALAIELATDRKAIYKTMFDARRKIRAALVTNGHLSGRPEDHA